MVREILLRLDDYRDLVNSAQASPVMQTMIDSQSIWKKLCRYHFTEQQLEMALNSGSSILVKKNHLRGVKYARTTSADGRGSYRNPIAHKHASSLSKTTVTKRQTEQTSIRRGSSTDRRNANCKEISVGSSSSSSSSSNSSGSSSSSNNGSPTPSTSASYVTNAVRIFDDKQEGTVRANCDSKSGGSPSSNADTSRNIASSKGSSLNGDDSGLGQDAASSRGSSLKLDGSNSEIDWERIFHQLRK